jgi:hypothetical protein
MRKSTLLPILLVACGGSRETEPATPLPAATATVSATATASTAPPAIATVAPDPPPQDPSPAGIVVDRDVWINAFESALPVALCKDGSYFRSCFPITAPECEQLASSATRVCLGKVKKQLPAKFHQPDDGSAWGRQIGTCTGTSFETTLATRKIHNAKCDDVTAWL